MATLDSEPPVDLVQAFAQRYTAAWCSQDAARVAACFMPKGSLSINGGTPSVGRSAITEVAQDFMNIFPDMVITMEDIFPVGDQFIYTWTLTGTNTGPGGTGNKVCISGHEEWLFGPLGLVGRSMGHFDSADYQRQLGKS